MRMVELMLMFNRNLESRHTLWNVWFISITMTFSETIFYFVCIELAYSSDVDEDLFLMDQVVKLRNNTGLQDGRVSFLNQWLKGDKTKVTMKLEFTVDNK